MAPRNKKLADLTSNLTRSIPATEPEKPAKRKAVTAEDFVQDRKRRPVGRPKGAVAKKPVTLYLPEKLHDDLYYAGIAAGSSMSSILEALLQSYVDAKAHAIEAARRATVPEQMVVKAKFS